MSSRLPLLPVYPHVADEDNSCSELLATVITNKGSCIWELGCRDRLLLHDSKAYKLMHDIKPSFDFEVGWFVGHRLHQWVAFYDVLHPNPFLFCLLFRLLHTHTHIYS